MSFHGTFGFYMSSHARVFHPVHGIAHKKALQILQHGVGSSSNHRVRSQNDLRKSEEIIC